MADIIVQNEGTIFLFHALTDEAKAWIEENVNEEGYQPDYPHRLVVEHRYAEDLANGMREGGLVLE